MVIQDMKKMFHRIGAMALVFMLALSLAAPVMATETPKKTLTIKNALAGQTYKVYQVLGLEYTPAEKTGETVTKPATYKYTYDKTNTDLVAALTDLVKNGFTVTEGETTKTYSYGTEEKAGVTLRGKTESGNVAGFIMDEHNSVLVFQLMMKQTVPSTEPGGADTTKFVLATDEQYKTWQKSNEGLKFSSDFAEDLRIKLKTGTDGNPDKLGTPVGTPIANEEDKTVKFENLEDGFYMVVSGANRWAMTFTFAAGDEKDLVITEKNSVPSVDKRALEGNGYADENDRGIGDDVKFRAELDVGSGVAQLLFEDTLSKGLTFVQFDSIQFYPRNKAGNVVTTLDDDAIAGNRTIFAASKPVLDTEHFDGAGKFVLLIDDAEVQKVIVGGESVSNFNVDVKAEAVTNDQNVATGETKLTVAFASAWLGSKRSENDNGGITAANRKDYTKEPMQNGDSRLGKYSDFAGKDYGAFGTYDASWFNQYIGDVSDPADDGGKIVIEYTARVNKDAVIGESGNENNAIVKYSNNPGTKENPYDLTGMDDGTPDKTKTYVYELDILKHAMGDKSVVLQGAKFELRRVHTADILNDWLVKETKDSKEIVTGIEIKNGTDGSNVYTTFKNGLPTEAKPDGTDPMAFVKVSDGNYRVAESGEAGTVTELESDVNGSIKIKGLDSDLYALKETEAPDGYVLAKDYMYVVMGGVATGTVTKDSKTETVDGKEKVTYLVSSNVYTQVKDAETKFEKTAADANNGLNIENASGLVMPTTGGIGTTIFYVVGVALVVGAGVLLVVKKRTDGSK